MKHWSPYIIQSLRKTIVLTDSRPCVQAYEKLSRGCYSSSARVSTFLTVASSYHVVIRHLSGAANLPSDFASRNAPDCNERNCQICQFVEELEDAVVNAVTVSDIASGAAKLPYTTRSTWISTQSEDPDIRRTIAHLKQGTRPSKKLTNIKDVKRYLQCCTVARDGLLVVKKEQPFAAIRESFVVPRSVLPGLLTALHVRLQHPTPYQFKQVVSRYFYALDLERAIQAATSLCHQCASLKRLPSQVLEMSTSEPPSVVGTRFAGDVIRRSRQCILVVRETVTSLTTATIIDNEQASTLKNGLIQLILPLHPSIAPEASIRVDPAPGFLPLAADESLKKYNFTVDVGERKNVNKNPVAEKAVQELEQELLRQDPSGEPVTEVVLAVAVSTLNSRIRNRGLSSHEMWIQREQSSNVQVNLQDKHLY